MRVRAVRRLQFCAGHRVVGHEGKCKYPHGHNYVVFVHAEARELDSVGRVIDFGVLKEKLGGWLDQCWDHKFILWNKDSELLSALSKPCSSAPGAGAIYPLPDNPTAENMARFLMWAICPMLFQKDGIEVVKVVVWETENCYAEVTLE